MRHAEVSPEGFSEPGKALVSVIIKTPSCSISITDPNLRVDHWHDNGELVWIVTGTGPVGKEYRATGINLVLTIHEVLGQMLGGS